MKNSIKILAVIIMVIITSMSNSFGQVTLALHTTNTNVKFINLESVDGQTCIDNLRKFQYNNDTIDNPVNNDTLTYKIQIGSGNFDVVDSVVKIEDECASENVYKFSYTVDNENVVNIFIKCNIRKSTLGLNDVNVSNLTLYPNPVMNVLNINFDATEDVDVTVMDMSGRVLYTETTSMLTSVDMSDQPSGMYLVKVGNEMIKVVKQ